MVGPRRDAGAGVGRRVGDLWSPDDLLAEGLYCPTAAIRSELERWRRRVGRPWCLLLPYPAGRSQTSFGSLMTVSHVDRDLTSQLQTDIAGATTEAASRQLARLLQAIVEPDGRWDQVPLPDDQSAELRNLRCLTPLADLGELEAVSLHRPPRWSTPTGARFVVLAATAAEDRSATELVADGDLVTLQTMLNGTRQAMLRQHHRAAVKLSRRPGPTVDSPALVPAIEDYLPDPSTAHFGPGLEFDDLLTEAEDRHRGRLVLAVYLIDRSGRRLLPVAGRNLSPETTEIDADAEESSIAVAVQDNRPPQLVNRVLAEPNLHGPRVVHWLGPAPKPADFSEIVVPISGTATGRSTVVGALVAQCRSGNGQVFGSRDLQYYEQLAGRISLRRANLLFAEATRSLAELTSHTMLDSAGAADPSLLDPTWRQLPIDFANARPFLRRTLGLVHRQSPCTGVALALLDVTQEKLVRVMEVGASDLVPRTWPRRKPSPGLAGLGSWALRHGQLGEVANVQAARAFQAFGGAVTGEGWGGSRSAMAAPVLVADRPVGVMVVAAAQEHVLSELSSFVSAAAQQLCLSLILAQRAEERRAFAFSSSTALHAHEILKRTDKLQRHADPQVVELGQQVAQLVDVLRTSDAERFLPTDPLVALAEAITETNVGHYVVWDNTPPTLPPFPPATILAVKRAAVEILRNSRFRMIGGRIQLRARVVQDSELPQLLIELQHQIETPLPEAMLSQLYRAPIEDGAGETAARRHYGAFTAGYWMRAVGGDVYLWRHQTDAMGRHWIGTAIEVPIFTLAPTEATGR